jgi:hypothetical protein
MPCRALLIFQGPSVAVSLRIEVSAFFHGMPVAAYATSRKPGIPCSLTCVTHNQYPRAALLLIRYGRAARPRLARRAVRLKLAGVAVAAHDSPAPTPQRLRAIGRAGADLVGGRSFRGGRQHPFLPRQNQSVTEQVRVYAGTSRITSSMEKLGHRTPPRYAALPLCRHQLPHSSSGSRQSLCNSRQSAGVLARLLIAAIHSITQLGRRTNPRPDAQSPSTA